MPSHHPSLPLPLAPTLLLLPRPAPLAGSPSYPPVQYFNYNGTVVVNGQTCWLWVLDGLAYVTQRTKQQNPVALLDGNTGIITFFFGFEAFVGPAQWPPGYWMVPDPCPTAEEEEEAPAAAPAAALRGA
jgi:hypothetical protein